MARELFALEKSVIQEVLRHLTEHPITKLYEKVSQAIPVQEKPADTTEAKDVTPSAN